MLEEMNKGDRREKDLLDQIETVSNLLKTKRNMPNITPQQTLLLILHHFSLNKLQTDVITLEEMLRSEQLEFLRSQCLREESNKELNLWKKQIDRHTAVTEERQQKIKHDLQELIRNINLDFP